jgi:hypothetical protein
MPRSEVLRLVGVVGSDLLSRRYCFLAVGVAKEQNEQGGYQSETLELLECTGMPKEHSQSTEI